MFEHYLPNKNEYATVAPKSKFRELNKGLALETPSYIPTRFGREDRGRVRGFVLRAEEKR